MKLFLQALAIVFLFSFAVNEWKLVKESESIKVYTRKVDGSKYEQIKIVARIKAPISEIVKALEDVDHHKNWCYGTKESYFVNKNDVSSFDYYVKMGMPFPVKDRDVTIRYKREQNPETKIVQINAKAESGISEEKKRLVRINDFSSTYTITPQKDGFQEVLYFMSADPGGSIPAWVVNLFTTKGPIKTMEGLIELVEGGYYKDAVVEGIVD